MCYLYIIIFNDIESHNIYLLIIFFFNQSRGDVRNDNFAKSYSSISRTSTWIAAARGMELRWRKSLIAIAAAISHLSTEVDKNSRRKYGTKLASFFSLRDTDVLRHVVDAENPFLSRLPGGHGL